MRKHGKKFAVAVILVTVALLSISWDTADKIFQLPFMGQWLPAINPVHVGAKNYTVLNNLRYNDTGLETVEGYSAITTTPISGTIINGFQFRKDDETHFITKAYNGSSYLLYENTSAVPQQGNFSTTALSSNTLNNVFMASGQGSFSAGPAGTMLYADDNATLIYGGDELRVASFFTSSNAFVPPDEGDIVDGTNLVDNDLSSEYITLAGGTTDTYTKLLLHMNGVDGSTTFTDTAGLHTVTAVGGAHVEADDGVFGKSGYFDPDQDYLTTPDSSDWDFGTSPFTIETWCRFPSFVAARARFIYRQYVDGDNTISFTAYRFSSDSIEVSFRVVSGGVELVSLTSPSASVLGADAWHHFAVVRGWGGNANDFALVSDGVAIAIATANITMPNLSTPLIIAGQNTVGLTVNPTYLDEYRVTKGLARFVSDFTPPVAPYSLTVVAQQQYFYVGSPLQLNAIKLYISNPNTVSATLSGSVWSGGSWSDMTFTDGTRVGAVPLNQTGTISFTDAANLAKLRYLNGVVLYWYRFHLSTGTANIYKVTCGAPLQTVKDVWNASERTCTAFQALRSSKYEDYTYQVNEKSTVDAPFAATIGGLTATDKIFIMFDDPVMGIFVTMLGAKVNAAAAAISSIDYWDGSDYTTVGTLQDKTAPAFVTSFAQTGSISWSPLPLNLEQPVEKFGKLGYVYRINLSGTLTDGTAHDGTSIDLLTGIAAPLKMTGYDKVGFYSGRAMLIKDNRVDYSLPDAPWVYNGVNTSDGGRLSLFFGDENKITATSSLFNRYGSNIIESWIVCKTGETYLLTGAQPYFDFNEPFVKRTISTNIGCPAPMTMVSAEIGFEVAEEAKRNALIWLDSSGPVLFDGAILTPMPGIENYFDTTKTEYINTSNISLATAYYDHIHHEYNLLIPSGAAAAANNTWLVCDLKGRRWYRKAPSEYPVYTVPVKDSDGVRYNYGHLASGHLMRLDYGATWNGTAISQEIKTGLFSPPVADEIGFWTQAELRDIKLMSSKITEDRDVTVSAYVDGTLSSKTLTIPLNAASGAVSRNEAGEKSMGIMGYLYQVDFAASTSSEKWEPLVWGYKARMIRED